MALKRYCNLVPRGFRSCDEHQEIEGKASIIHSGYSLLRHVQTKGTSIFCSFSPREKYILILILMSMAGLASAAKLSMPWYINGTM